MAFTPYQISDYLLGEIEGKLVWGLRAMAQVFYPLIKKEPERDRRGSVGTHDRGRNSDRRDRVNYVPEREEEELGEE